MIHAVCKFFNYCGSLCAFCQHIKSDWFYTLKFWYVLYVLQSIKMYFAACHKNFASAAVVMVCFFFLLSHFRPHVKVSVQRKNILFINF